MNLDPEFWPNSDLDPGRCIISSVCLVPTVTVLVLVPESMMTGGTPLPWLSWSGHTWTGNSAAWPHTNTRIYILNSNSLLYSFFEILSSSYEQIYQKVFPLCLLMPELGRLSNTAPTMIAFFSITEPEPHTFGWRRSSSNKRKFNKLVTGTFWILSTFVPACFNDFKKCYLYFNFPKSKKFK